MLIVRVCAFEYGASISGTFFGTIMRWSRYRLFVAPALALVRFAPPVSLLDFQVVSALYSGADPIQEWEFREAGW